MRFLIQIIAFLLLFSLKSFAFQNEIKIHTNSFRFNLKESSLVFTSEKNISVENLKNDFFTKEKTIKDFFYFDFNKNSNFINFHITNCLEEDTELFLRFSNTMINEIILYRNDSKKIKELYRTGIKHSIKTKISGNRNFIIPIKLIRAEKSSFIIQINKQQGRPLVTEINLVDGNTLNSSSLKQNIIIGIYVGLSFIFMLLGFALFFILKKTTYLFYACYLFFLGFFIISYTGVFQQFFLSEEMLVNKYLHYVIFSELALVFFVVFSQKFLEVKKYQPKLYKIILSIVLIAVVLRLLLHFFFNNFFSSFIPTFMKVWYAIHFLGISIIAYQILMLYKKDKQKNILFAMAYLLMIFGSLISILYHSFGLVDGVVFNLPILLFTSLLEIIFISLALGLIVKEMIDQKRELLHTVKKQEQQNIKAYIELKNRSRIHLDRLIYIKSEGNYLEFFTEKEKFLDRNQLKKVLEQLPTNFVRIHRSYIINKNYIKLISSTSVVLITEVEVPLSRTFKKNLIS